MTSEINRQWVLAARPVGMVKPSDFELREGPVPTPAEGQVLVRNLYLAFDPAMRGWMTDRESYMPPVGIGEVMRGATVGQVVESHSSELRPGELVQSMALGWQDYGVVSPGGPALLTRVAPGASPTMYLSLLGITGLTAYFGMREVGRPREGETVLVSGAAGATGSVAAQIAKLEGCRVIGIAGGPEKCDWLTAKAGLDAAIDYKAEDVRQRLRELCPDGIHVYFDNVGGAILEAALDRIANGARVVLSGAISLYGQTQPAPGPRNLTNLVLRRARMEGFIVLDYLPRLAEATRDLTRWASEGRIVYEEDIQEGFENAPAALLRLFQGKNLGKQLLKIADPPIALNA